MRHLLAALFVTVALGLPWLYVNDSVHFTDAVSALKNAGVQLAAIILAHRPKTVAEIQAKYASSSRSFFPNPSASKVRVLLVPGHEPNYGGAEYDSPYGHLRERDFTVDLAKDLQGFLLEDPHYQVFITRDYKNWDPVFLDYFTKGWNDIVEWQKAYKQEFSQMIANGSTTLPEATVSHISAPNDVALHLYGITKWANENDIDIEVHIHFNDNPGHMDDRPGGHSGFAVYIPAVQYQNSSTTRAIADAVFKRLAKYNPVSDLPGESLGLVDDPELIAIGANDTADAASMLIEYSYIYEPQLDDPDTRALFIKDLAYETYLGLGDFFNAAKSQGLTSAYDTVMLPHQWKSSPTADKASSSEIFVLQSALLIDGEYPPAGKNKNDCPRTGGFGPCTRAALKKFQDKNGIIGEDGMAGPKTLEVLNRQFGA